MTREDDANEARPSHEAESGLLRFVTTERVVITLRGDCRNLRHPATMRRMANGLLYSVNPVVKLMIQEEFRGDLHFVWCSQEFDPAKAPRFSRIGLTASSSSPAEIYAELLKYSRKPDDHCSKVIELKASMKARAIQWCTDGEISKTQEEDIVALLDDRDPTLWRPLIYVIPSANLGARVQHVPRGKRASAGPEFTISDLARAEFDTIEMSQ